MMKFIKLELQIHLIIKTFHDSIFRDDKGELVTASFSKGSQKRVSGKKNKRRRMEIRKVE